jgi:chorismate mutase
MNRNAEASAHALAANRNEIDTVDTELLRLINKRAGIALRLAAIKKVLERDICDANRERLVVDRACAKNRGPLDGNGITNIFRSIIQECRKVQEVNADLPEVRE